MKKECPLCKSSASLFCEDKQTYYKCECCAGIFTDRDELPDSSSEKERYELHSDDSQDIGYIKFVSPLTDRIQQEHTQRESGLDFGAGTSCIVSSILHKSNYMIKNYDPFFHNNRELLEDTYDYISSCEVVEHFYNPYKEFELLKKLLKENGKMYLMTEPYKNSIDFSKWYYKNDSTHVFFYMEETFEWIKKEFGFSGLEVKGRVVLFEN